ncbi:MAG: choice-of-anchor Q domain-containing protein [Bacteroidota bacterium]
MKSFTPQSQGLLFLLLLAFLLPATSGHAQTKQTWQQISQRSTNFYEIKAAFMEENAAKLAEYEKEMTDLRDGRITQITKGKYPGIKQFMRMAEWYEPRVKESNGDLRVMGQKDIEARINAMNTPQAVNAANWTILGPTSIPASTGNGRVNNIRIDPVNPNILYACTPASQLFKSTDAGGSWNPISNSIPAPGVTDLAINPTNTNILYAITGDGDQAIYHPYSAGLYKSTNGGASWSPTGLSYVQANTKGLTSIIIHPTNTNTILVSGTNGIHRSTDGGVTFTQTYTTDMQNIVFKPGDPNTVFAGGKWSGVFIRSTDNGVTWTQITTGLPSAANTYRYAIDVSPVNPNYVYAMVSNYLDMQGFYFSSDAGLTFKQMATTPNIGGGQAWYDFAVVADPLSNKTVYACGIDVFKSIDTGKTWTNMTNVYTGGSTHPDMHDLTFSGTTTLYLANDGGVYRTTNGGSTWTNISSNLSIAQPYAIGLSASNANTIISGLQDNGTILTNDVVNWRRTRGGDGMIGFIDYTNDNNMYSSQQNGGLGRSTNGGANWTTATSGLTGTRYWVTPYVQDPVAPATIYCGTDMVFRSVNGAVSWTAISPSFTTVRWIDVDKNNTQIIYAMTNNTVQKTINGGTNWAPAATGLGGGELLRIHIDANNSNTLYVATASYNGQGVYRSTDAGATWSLWATGLPNVPVNTVLTQTGSPGEVYCGTDIGVYYRSGADASWSSFNTNLPVVPVRDLEIFYPTGKLRAGTFGRGIWETPLNAASVCPFTYLNSIAYVNAAATAGTNSGTSWANAYLSLDSALSVANKCDYVTQVWVAAGTYKPTTSTNRNISFSMVNGIAVYGGFPATGSPTFAQRNVTVNKTILSGDIGVPGLATDNSWHVISNPRGLNNTAILDGFTITDGYTDVAAGFQNSGGGVYNNGTAFGQSCSPRFANCVFKGNKASVWGGAVYNDGGYSGKCAAEYYNCIFESNNSLDKGGAVYNGGNSNGNCTPIFTNCVFTGNSAGTYGGAVFNDATSGICSPVFTHCSFQNNSAPQGGGLYNLGTTGTCTPVLTSCLFYGNGAANTFINSSASIFASYNLFEKGTINYINSAGNALTAVSPFVLANDAHIKEGSVAIDAGKTTGAPLRDLDSVTRSAIPDIGAYENLQSCIGASKTYWSDAPGTSYQWQKNDGTGYVDIANGALYGNVTTNKLTVIAPANITTGHKFRCRVITAGGSTVYSSEIILRFYNRWLGAADNSWLNAANWSCGVVPNQYTDVIMPSAKTIYPLTNVSGTIRRLQVENGSSITVKTGSSLVIVGKE